MKIRKFGLLAVACLALLLCSAKFWETKKYTEWDEQECKQLLTKSPWAFTNSFARLSEIGFRIGGEPQGIKGPWPNTRGERESYIIFECRLLSAKPIRMALARLQMLENPHAAPPIGPLEQYVNSDPGKEILVQVSFNTKPANASTMQSLLSMFRSASVASFRESTLLISKRKTVGLVAYIQPNDKTPLPVFVFPRFAPDGTPYFTKDDKSVAFRSEFTGYRFGVYQEFDPKEMVFDGAFEM